MTADFRLVDRGWVGEIERAVAASPSTVRLACPFIKQSVIERLLKGGRGRRLEVVTRFDLKAFYHGVSDIGALRLIIEAGGEVRGLKGLHSKLFLFDRLCTIAGSANLTEAGLGRNHEFGFITNDGSITDQCHGYFGRLWRASKKGATLLDLESWSSKVEAASRIYSRSAPNLPDYGVSATGLSEESPFIEDGVDMPDGAQFFVKFFGRGRERAALSEPIASHVLRSGCHWACTYGKRPRNVQDGATMFMARVTRRPNDIRIFGQAIGRRHRDGTDDASVAEIEARPWKRSWPYHVRVHNPQFIDGNLEDGISLNALMERFGADAFMPTRRNVAAGRGNTNPRRSLSQQPQIELTPLAAAWLTEQMDLSYRTHGTIDLTDPGYDWPPVV